MNKQIYMKIKQTIFIKNTYCDIISK